MLRRYAAGSSLGSGGAGRVMSGSDGDVYVDPLSILGDLSEFLEEREPFRGAESPLVAALPFFRLKRRILGGTMKEEKDVSALVRS